MCYGYKRMHALFSKNPSFVPLAFSVQANDMPSDDEYEEVEGHDVILVSDNNEQNANEADYEVEADDWNILISEVENPQPIWEEEEMRQEEL
ncbi:hypothetical protein BGZ76_000462 [Entomortierella beljakovae]|nr:hypothetical protein BGZ76_000462 [Entomortierella beljakovae]